MREYGFRFQLGRHFGLEATFSAKEPMVAEYLADEGFRLFSVQETGPAASGRFDAYAIEGERSAWVKDCDANDLAALVLALAPRPVLAGSK